MLSNSVETRATSIFLATSLAAADQFKRLAINVRELAGMVDVGQVREIIGMRAVEAVAI